MNVEKCQLRELVYGRCRFENNTDTGHIGYST